MITYFEFLFDDEVTTFGKVYSWVSRREIIAEQLPDKTKISYRNLKDYWIRSSHRVHHILLEKKKEDILADWWIWRCENIWLLYLDSVFSLIKSIDNS